MFLSFDVLRVTAFSQNAVRLFTDRVRYRLGRAVATGKSAEVELNRPSDSLTQRRCG